MTPRTSPLGALSRERLRKLAGERSYERGERYALDQRVGEIAEDGGQLSAFVHGERRYRTSLVMSRTRLTCECSCPVGEDGACCKHVVALGLTWLDAGADAAANELVASPARARKRVGEQRTLTMKDVRAHLSALPSETLVELVVEQAMHDERLRQRLLLEAAKATSSGVKLHTYRRALTAAIGSGEFVHYREAHGYFLQIGELVTSLEELCESDPTAVIELVEHAFTLLEDAMGHVDDSDGNARDVLDRLHELHLKACRRARPDVEALATRLFEWELASEFEILANSASRYAKVLGRKGLSYYRTLAEAKWAKVPMLGPGHSNRSFDGSRFRITQIMESLARVTNDVDALVAVQERDLSSAYNYLRIAELLRKAKRTNEALAWAERGLAAFPVNTDGRLREFVAALYVRRKRVADALELLWLNFTDRPWLIHYCALHAAAKPSGQWTPWRERALAHVRGTLERNALLHTSTSRSPTSYAPDGSLLVELYLWEGDGQAAWDEANAWGCSSQLWLRLAKSRELSHPEDAVRVYQESLADTLSQTNNHAYQQAVAELRVIRRVMESATIPGGFAAYLAELRTRHKAKRNFMKLLDAAKL